MQELLEFPSHSACLMQEGMVVHTLAIPLMNQVIQKDQVVQVVEQVPIVL